MPLMLFKASDPPSASIALFSKPIASTVPFSLPFEVGCDSVLERYNQAQIGDDRKLEENRIFSVYMM